MAQLALLALLAAAASHPQSTGTPPEVRLAPFVVRVAFDLSPGLQIDDCRVSSEGEPHSYWLDEPCRNIATAGFLEALGFDDRSAGRVTAVLQLHSGTGAVPPATAPGTLVASRSVRFGVGPDGSVEACELGESVGGGISLNLCPALPHPPNPFVALPTGGAREGQLRLSFHLETTG